MAKSKKDTAVVIVMTDLTGNQASRMIGEIQKSKIRNAPAARATFANVETSAISDYIGTKNVKRIK